MANNNPSIDPANNDSLAGSLRFAFSKLLQQVDGMLPAKVIKYNRTTNRVQVQLLIALMTTDGSQISRPQIASLPVLVMGGGGFILNFPLNEGDLGWVMANDRDISLFLQSYAETKPNTTRVKNFSDGVFIPDVMRGYTIQGEDTSNAVLQNTDGSVRISLSTNKIKIVAPTVEIESPATTIDGNLIVTGIITGQNGLSIEGGGGGGAFNVTGNMNLTGDIAVVGNITATGDITPHVP